jgi:hypothetical protein
MFTLCLLCVYYVSTVCLYLCINVSTVCLLCVYCVSTVCLLCVYYVSLVLCALDIASLTYSLTLLSPRYPVCVLCPVRRKGIPT